MPERFRKPQLKRLATLRNLTSLSDPDSAEARQRVTELKELLHKRYVKARIAFVEDSIPILGISQRIKVSIVFS